MALSLSGGSNQACTAREQRTFGMHPDPAGEIRESGRLLWEQYNNRS